VKGHHETRKGGSNGLKERVAGRGTKNLHVKKKGKEKLERGGGKKASGGPQEGVARGGGVLLKNKTKTSGVKTWEREGKRKGA